jgi:hypothetical protein
MADDFKKREREFSGKEQDRLKSLGEESAALDSTVSADFSAELKQHERRYHHTLAVRDKIAKYDADLQRKHEETLKQKVSLPFFSSHNNSSAHTTLIV